MTRGFYNSIQEMPEYSNAEKSWHITIDSSYFLWYDLIINPPFDEAKNELKEMLNNFKEYVEFTNEKRFIYFVTSRKKVCFDVKKQPKFSFFDKRKLIIYLLIGNKDKTKIEIYFPNEIPTNITVDEKFIYFHSEVFASLVYPIHYFLREYGVNLGIASEVHYVGITEDPVGRALGLKHRGLTEILYKVPTSENDIFLTVNTFKVGSFTKIEEKNIDIISTNSMIYDIPLDKEGLIIEKALIYYFNSKVQEVDRKSWGEFRNLLTMIKKKKNISSVSFHLEISDPNEYDIMGSKDVEANISHSFLWKLGEIEPELKKFNSEIELLEYTKVFSKDLDSI